MTFSEFEYQRPDKDAALNEIARISQQLETAEDYETFARAFERGNELFRHIDTMENLAYVRHTIDTRDEFYNGEFDYFNEISPLISNAKADLAKVVLESKWRPQLEQEIPATWFMLNENAQKTVSPKLWKISGRKSPGRPLPESDRFSPD